MGEGRKGLGSDGEKGDGWGDGGGGGGWEVWMLGSRQLRCLLRLLRTNIFLYEMRVQLFNVTFWNGVLRVCLSGVQDWLYRLNVGDECGATATTVKQILANIRHKYFLHSPVTLSCPCLCVIVSIILPRLSVWSMPHKLGTFFSHRLCTFISQAENTQQNTTIILQ